MKNILMVGNDISVHGGISYVIKNILSFDWRKDDINIIFIPTYKYNNIILMILFYFIAIIKICFYIFSKKIDIVYIHMSHKGSFYRANFIRKIANRFGIKVLVHLHSSEFINWYSALSKEKKKKIIQFFEKTDLVIVLGEKWKKRIKMLSKNIKTKIIYNSVPSTNYNATWNKNINFTFLGVLVERKGIFDLINALSIINSSNFVVNIAGDGRDKKIFIELCNKKNIKKYINYIGWVDKKEKEELLRKSQVLILPSHNEGLPISILEAMSFGLPIIASDVGDVSTAVYTNKNGILFEAGNIETLRKSIEYFLNISKNEWEKMSDESKKYYNEKFSNEKFYYNLNEVIKRL